MCGIAAIYAYRDAAPTVDLDELRAIRDHMKARGPDGKGEWLSDDARIGMAHRRLAIIDLSEDAAQPMVSDDGQIVISFNGEIYNYQVLRERLIDKGYRFRSHSDTEVLLHLYREMGEALVNELRGMFAFAIWDANKGSMLLARDPYGIKPLYYADDGKTLRVASQVKALLAGGEIPTQKDPAGVVGFYMLGSVPEPYTIYSAIRALPAGNLLWIDEAGVRQPKNYSSISRIWADAEQHPLQTENIEEETRKALLDSVRHHMVSDVPVGIFLSAGVDSGALLGLMRELSPHTEIQSVTLAYDEYQGTHEDESILAEKVAQRYGAKHKRRVVTQKEFLEDLPKILDAMDQPSIDGINAWFVSKAANELGIKVAISGLGGDELFGGYPAFSDVPRWQRYFTLPSKIPFLGDLVRRTGGKLFGDSINPKALGLVKYGGSYAGAWLLRRAIYMPWELNQLLQPEFVSEGLKHLKPIEHIDQVMGPDLNKPFSKVAAMESSLYMRNQLLRDADWAGMAHSLEIRVPLVDAVLLKRLAPLITAQARIEGKKWLGHSPANRLPDEIIKRPKTGFTTPIRDWMKDSLKSDNDGNHHWSRSWCRHVASEWR